MAKIPYSRVVNVTMTRNDRFPSRRGFGTQLILTHQAVAGVVDANNRTKLYTTLEEVQADWPTTASAYEAALAAFMQNPRPLRVKIGYLAAPSGSTPEELGNAIETELAALYDQDQAWYMATIDKSMRDQPYLDALMKWIEAHPKQAMLDSNDEKLTDPTDTTNIAARNKGTLERSSVFYHTDQSAYLASAASAYMSTRNFDDADSAYTLKFKKARGIKAVNIGSAALTAVTGFIEQLGQQESSGHCANTYIDIGDQDFLVEGSTLTQNVFLDEIHATDWIIARTEELVLGLYLNNARIPYTDQGMQMLASVPRAVMALGVRAGIVAKDLNPETGDYEPAYTVDVPSVFDVTTDQRKARIAPAIAVRFRYAGAVHYTTINYTMDF